MEGFVSSDQDTNERQPDCAIHSSNLLAQEEHLENHQVTCSASKSVDVCEQRKEVRDSGEYTQTKTECSELSQTPCGKVFTVSLHGDTLGAVTYDGCHQSAILSKKIQNFPLVVRTPVSTKSVTKDVQISQLERKDSSKATPNILKVIPKRKSYKITHSSCHEGSVGSDLKRHNMKILTATEPHCKMDAKKKYYILRLNRKKDSLPYQRNNATKQGEKAGSFQRGECGEFFAQDSHLDLHASHHALNKEHQSLIKSESNSIICEEKTWPGFIQKTVESQSEKELLPPIESEDKDIVKEMLSNYSVLANPEGHVATSSKENGVDCDIDEDVLLQNAQGSLQFLQDLGSVDTSGNEKSSQLRQINGSRPMINGWMWHEQFDDSASKPLNTGKQKAVLSDGVETVLPKRQRPGDRLCVKNSALSALIAARNNKYICKLCCKSFESISGVRHHLRIIHLRLERQKCPECGKICPSNTLFRMHMRTHTGERPYSCQKCGKSFTARSVLKIHEQRHFMGKTKTLSCPGCGLNFSNLVELLEEWRST